MWTAMCSFQSIKSSYFFRVSLMPQIFSQFYYNFAMWQLGKGEIMDPHRPTILFPLITSHHITKLLKNLWYKIYSFF